MAIEFDSSSGSEAVVFPSLSAYDFDPDTEEFSISAWMICPSNSNGTIFSRRATFFVGWQFGVTNSGGTDILFSRCGGVLNTTSTTAVDDGLLHHVAMVNRDVSGTHRSFIYLDGVLTSSSGSAPASGHAASTTIDAVANARRDLSNFDFAFEGDFTLSDLRLYDIALSAANVANMAAAKGKDNLYSGMILRAKMDDRTEGTSLSGSGIIKDQSINQNHGTPNSTPNSVSKLVSMQRKNPYQWQM